MPTLSLTEAQELTALREFLLATVMVGTQVIKGQVNRVSMPAQKDFVVYWPIRSTRLSTNETTYADNILVGSIAGAILTVTSLIQVEAPLGQGVQLTDGTAGLIAPNTVMGAQLSGSVGGTGTYTVSPIQTLSGEVLYAGARNDLVPAEYTVQVDIHGPNSADNARIVEGLFRSEVGTDLFSASGYAVQALYCDEARQVPFINAENQWDERWTLDMHMQTNPVIGTVQDYATGLHVHLVEVDSTYPP